MTETQGILLTGGRSQRMGMDKSTLNLGMKNFTEHIIGELKTVTKDILIVGPEVAYKNYNGKFYRDIYEEKGPAVGILTGLTHSLHDLNFVLSCDVPLIKNTLLVELMNQYNGQDALICMKGDRLHPLVGIYHKKSAPIFKTCIEKNTLKLAFILSELKVGYYSVPDKWLDQLSNINTPQQYETLKNDYSN